MPLLWIVVPHMTTTYPEWSKLIHSQDYKGRHYAVAVSELRYTSQDDFEKDARSNFDTRKHNIPMFDVGAEKTTLSESYANAPFAVVFVYTAAEVVAGKSLNEIPAVGATNAQALLVRNPVTNLPSIMNEYLADLEVTVA